MKRKRGGAFDIMAPVPDIDYILLDIESIKGKFSHPIRSALIKTLPALMAVEGFSELHITEINQDNLGHKYQLYVIERDVIVCVVSFIINESGSNLGYIDLITSNSKSVNYTPSSYLAFYQVFKIFEHFGISYCYLYVLPDEDRYWKLYNFYSMIGFYCLPYDTPDKTINNVIKLTSNARNEFFLEHKVTNTFIQTHKNAKRNNNNIRAYFDSCQHMFGKVADMIENVKTKLKIH